MAWKKIAENFCPCINGCKCEYIADTDADLENLPAAGTSSTAVSLESGKIKVVNTNGEWVDFGG